MFNYDYIIAVGLGAVLGALLRWSIGLITYPLWDNALTGTLIVNLLGCFIAGICTALYAENQASEVIRLFLFVGFLGSFTTFSSFSLEIVSLLEQAKLMSAFIMAGLQVGGSLAAVFLGLSLAGWLKK